MEDWQSALWVAAIAAVSGLVGALIGRERWPADLRDAKRLSEIVEKMEPETKERELAAMYRDDLTARWIFGRVATLGDVRRDLGLALIVIGSVTVLLGGLGLPIAAYLGLFGDAGSDPGATFFVVILVGVALFGLGIWLANSYLNRWNKSLTDLRAARGMRPPVDDWVNEFRKGQKRSKRMRPSLSGKPSAPSLKGDAFPNQS
ncbi:hypothetical protein ABZ477_03815 [Microbacterium sp. NPDC019599]|uniref:hypothetical protein n=1 Tax=Microbacterium sp. NPDC019599 TaxID=3154690 RepID=UPI0033FD7B85